MKKLIIQLLCAEIVRLQELANTDGKEVLQEQCETSAKAMLRQGVEIQKLRAEIKELQAYKEANTVAVKLDTPYFVNEIDAIAKAYTFALKEQIAALKAENERLQNLVEYANDKHNMFALKDKNERLEKWDKEHREKIETLAIELNASEKLVRSLQFQNDNFRKINQNFKRTLEDLAQWKNSVKDGLPKIEIGTVIVFQFSGDTGYDKWDFLESDDIDGFNTYISQRQIGYYIIIKIDNAAN